MIKTNILILLFLVSSAFSSEQKSEKEPMKSKISLEWTEDLKGDFSFKEKWNYPAYVYKNSFGQLSCDGLCPPQAESMKDANGKIYQDSLQAFYEIVDTTHIAHSLKSENKMYEYSGTDFITFKRKENNIVIGESSTNASTHSKLVIKIQDDICTAWADFNSIRDLGQHVFSAHQGTIKVDQALFKKGIIKATFDLRFENTIDAKEKLFWKGQIYSKIRN